MDLGSIPVLENTYFRHEVVLRLLLRTICASTSAKERSHCDFCFGLKGAVGYDPLCALKVGSIICDSRRSLVTVKDVPAHHNRRELKMTLKTSYKIITVSIAEFFVVLGLE